MRRIHSCYDAERKDQSLNALALTWSRGQNKSHNGNSVNLVDLPRYEATKLPIASPLFSDLYLAF